MIRYKYKVCMQLTQNEVGLYGKIRTVSVGRHYLLLHFCMDRQIVSGEDTICGGHSICHCISAWIVR